MSNTAANDENPPALHGKVQSTERVANTLDFPSTRERFVPAFLPRRMRQGVSLDKSTHSRD